MARDHRVEALRLTGVVGVRPAAIAEARIAAARVEQTVVADPGFAAGLNSTYPNGCVRF